MEDLDLGVVIVRGLDTLMTYVILDLSVVIVIGLDTLMKHPILCIVNHPKYACSRSNVIGNKRVYLSQEEYNEYLQYQASK